MLLCTRAASSFLGRSTLQQASDGRIDFDFAIILLPVETFSVLESWLLQVKELFLNGVHSDRNLGPFEVRWKYLLSPPSLEVALLQHSTLEGGCSIKDSLSAVTLKEFQAVAGLLQ